MIHFGKQADVPARDLIREYLLFSDDVLDELGSRKEIKYIHTMLEQGSGADRQLKVFRETRSLKAVVDYMALETRAGLHNGERVLTSRGRRILGKEQDHLLYRSGANG